MINRIYMFGVVAVVVWVTAMFIASHVGATVNH